jgi:hypothetical protein
MISRAIVVFAATAVTGGVLGWSSASHPVAGDAVRRTTAGQRETLRPKWGKEDFVKAIRERAAIPNFNPLAGDLANWTDEELKAALETSLVHPDCRIPGDPAANLPRLLLTAKKYAPGMGNGGSDHFNKVHGYFDRTMEELNLPTEARETVKAALALPAGEE